MKLLKTILLSVCTAANLTCFILGCAGVTDRPGLTIIIGAIGTLCSLGAFGLIFGESANK